MKGRILSIAIALIVGVYSMYWVFNSGILYVSPRLWISCGTSLVKSGTFQASPPANVVQDCFGQGLPTLYGFFVIIGVGVITGIIVWRLMNFLVKRRRNNQELKS